MLDDDLPLQPQEIESLINIADKISEFHVVNRVGKSGETRKVITEEIIKIIRKALASDHLTKLSLNLKNCDSDKSREKMLELFSMERAGKIAARSPKAVADALKTDNEESFYVTWRFI